MKMMLARLSVAAVLVLVASEAVADRVALVVGNNAYTSLPVLDNAVNDAQAMAEALEEVGFTVTKVENATRDKLAAALGTFAGKLQGDDEALFFFFAGHGVQVNQTNYLLPTDYAGRTAAAVELSAFSAVQVEGLLRPARVAMLVLDACRNNPYRGIRTSGGGLAAMEARGTLIAFAAGAGEVAADAAGPGSSNGLFTAKLVEALQVPGLTASALFQQVRREVYAASDEEQFPAVYDQLLSDFVFRPGSVVRDRTTENLFWQSIVNSSNPADFEDYLQQFADGTFASLARRRIEALTDVTDVVPPPPDVAQLDVAQLRQIAEQGDARAQTELGERYEDGRDGVPQDYGRAVSWFRRAADQGFAAGQDALGFMYLEGRGVAQDDWVEAVTWFRRAAEQGYARGQYNLGNRYENGSGVAQDDGEAVTWYRRAAEQGYARGQYNLGFMYDTGRGVAQDYGEAVTWYRRAAEQEGDNLAATSGQDSLGFMYREGRGVAQDDGEAVTWYRRAAEQGHARGQYNLGFMYREGRGVAQDDGEAVTWYRRAAEQGHARGQANLGVMYENGRGVAQDDGGSRHVVPPSRRTGTRPRAGQPRRDVRERARGGAGRRGSRHVVPPSRRTGTRPRAVQPRLHVRERARGATGSRGSCPVVPFGSRPGTCRCPEETRPLAVVRIQASGAEGKDGKIEPQPPQGVTQPAASVSPPPRTSPPERRVGQPVFV